MYSASISVFLLEGELQHQHQTEEEGGPVASNLTHLMRFVRMEGSDSMGDSNVRKSERQLLGADGMMMDKGGRAILVGMCRPA